jgi:hypothetical protein
LICSECRTVTSASDADHQTSNGIGGSGRGASGEGGSGEGVTYPSVPSFASPANAYARWLCGDDLAALDSDPDLARFVCHKAGIPFKQDGPQRIRVGESEVTVRLWLDDLDRYVFRAVGQQPKPVFPGTRIQALKLGQFYATVCAGRVIRPTGPSLARWTRRALIESGAVTPPPVWLKPPPDDAPSYIPIFWAMVGLLLSVRLLTEPDERTVPLCRSFMPDWAGYEPLPTRRSLGWLDRHAFIWRSGDVVIEGKAKPMTLWGVAEEPTTEFAWANPLARGEIERKEAPARSLLRSDEAS